MHFDFMTMLFLLIVGHALADYPLQGDFLANGKNKNTALGKIFWPHALFAHSIIHGGFVVMITGNIWLGMAETAIHAGTDWLKCEGRISLRTDQTIHFACKLVWASVIAAMS